MPPVAISWLDKAVRCQYIDRVAYADIVYTMFVYTFCGGCYRMFNWRRRPALQDRKTHAKFCEECVIKCARPQDQN